VLTLKNKQNKKRPSTQQSNLTFSLDYWILHQNNIFNQLILTRTSKSSIGNVMIQPMH